MSRKRLDGDALALADEGTVGDWTLGQVAEVARRCSRAELEVGTHKARADAAERSRDAHARGEVEALAELPAILEFVRAMRRKYDEKAVDVGVEALAIGPDDAEARLASALERRAYGAAVSTCDAIAFRVEAVLDRKRAENEITFEAALERAAAILEGGKHATR